MNSEFFRYLGGTDIGVIRAMKILGVVVVLVSGFLCHFLDPR